MTIRITKSALVATPIFSGSAICSVCGVGSNLHPCYDEGEGTNVPHRLTYCGHRLDNEWQLLIPSEGIDL